MERLTTKYFLLAVFSLLCLTTATSQANTVKKLKISAPDGFGSAPQVNVYSTSGEKWNTVDKTKITRFRINLNAECKYEGKGNKAYRGRMSVSGFSLVGDSDEPANFLIPHAKEATGQYRFDEGQSLNPIKICNSELSKRLSEQPELSKYQLLAKGFIVNYPAAFTVGYHLTCKPTGLGFTDTASKSTKVNSKIVCLASALAEKKIPKPKPQVIPAKIVSLINTINFKASPDTYKGSCPTTIKFIGSITTNIAGTVKYRYVSHDDRVSSVFSLKFDKKGTRATRSWSRTLSKPAPSKTLSTGGKHSVYDIQGWYRLEILAPKPTGSVLAKYRIDCVVPTPARASIKN